MLRVAIALGIWSPTLLVNAVAQEAAPTGTQGIVTLLVQLGLSGVFLWQWMRADKRANDSQDKMLVLAERMLPALEECTRTLAAVQQAMERQVDRAAPASISTGDVRSLQDAVYRLEASLRAGRTEGPDADPH